jgi:hypothetical protein
LQPPAEAAAEPAAEPAPPPPQQIEGMRLDKVEPTPAQTSFALAVVLGLMLIMAFGAWRQGRRQT